MIQGNSSAGSRSKENIIFTGRLRHELAVHHLGTFRRRLGIPRRSVQEIDKTATEPLHLGKGVQFTTQVLYVERRTFSNGNLAGNVTPSSNRLIGMQLSDEAGEGNCAERSAANAGSVPDSSVEAGWITVIANIKVHVTWFRGSLGKRAGTFGYKQRSAQNEQGGAEDEHNSFLHLLLREGDIREDLEHQRADPRQGFVRHDTADVPSPPYPPIKVMEPCEPTNRAAIVVLEADR
jgi:hypothetical protein